MKDDNDLGDVDPKFEARFQKVLDGIPLSDKISHRENAESVARCLRGDLGSGEPVSEAEVQNALEWMNEREEERKQERAVLLFQVNRQFLFRDHLMT